MDDRLRDYILTLPEAVQEVAFRVPPDSCYRGEGKAHYRIHAYDEPAEGPIKVTLRVIHGADSSLPGMTVFGKDPDSLIPCGCGKWEPVDGWVN